MGVRGSLRLISPEAFAQARAGEEPDLGETVARHKKIISDLFVGQLPGPEELRSFRAEITASSISIDKAWYDLHQVFRVKGPPLSLAVSGDLPDVLDPFGPKNLDEFCMGNHEYYRGFASPELVQKVAKALRDLSAADYKQWETEQFGDQYNLGERCFPDLKAAYLDAAAKKCAMMIVIC